MSDTIVNVIRLPAASVRIGGMHIIHLVLRPSMKAIDPQAGDMLTGGIASMLR